MNLRRQKQLVHWFFMFAKVVQMSVQISVLVLAIMAFNQENESILILFCVISFLYVLGNFGMAFLYFREENSIFITEPLFLLVLTAYIPLIIGLSLSNLKRSRGKRNASFGPPENAAKMEIAIIDIIISTVVVILLQIIISGIVICTFKIAKKINEQNIASKIIKRRNISKEEVLIDQNTVNSKLD
ncbi:hypothetical protein Anas_07218 [Armadillidium nasatum]|uniref:Uncharacterized protein n=1 Tax=Armadillidium nasatum TaxID=96803 RepID=A0A5N5TBX5_9CRUS|nr:hypothetical protein Anas_07218 [Armadillidium nasatum]